MTDTESTLVVVVVVVIIGFVTHYKKMKMKIIRFLKRRVSKEC